MTATFFEVDGDYSAFAPGFQVSGTVTFEPLFYAGDVALAPSLTPPTAFIPFPVTAKITNGLLTALDGVSAMTLLANVGLGLSGDLYYRVSFSDVFATEYHPTITNLVVASWPVQLSGFDFRAPTSSSAVNLIGVTPMPGMIPIANIHAININASQILASGTASSSTFLRGDGTWAAPSGSGTGTVTTLSVVSVNGFSGSVTNPTSTPALSLGTTVTGLLKGNGTGVAAAVAGTDYLVPGGALGTPTSGNLANCSFPTLNQSTTGNAATATVLAAARTINGVSFDGSANIVVADATKEPAITAGTTSQYWRGDKTWQTLPGASASGMLQPVQIHGDGSETYTISSGTVTQISGTTLQGQAVNVGDRVLIFTAPAASGAGTQYTQTANPGNGIYVCTGNTTNLSLSRSSDMSGSVNPTGLSVYSENPSVGWFAQSVFTVTYPNVAATFTWGTTGTIFSGTSGLNILPKSVFVVTAGNIGFWNATPGIATYLQVNSSAPSGTTQYLTLPAPTTDTLVSRTSTDSLTNKNLTDSSNTFPTFNQNTTGTAGNVSGTVAVGNGGTGATSLTGIVKGTGTTAMVAATAGTDFVAPGGALGTPASGNLVNCLSGGNGIVSWVVTSVSTTLTFTATANTMFVYLLKSGAVPTLPTAVSNTSMYRVKNTTSAPITLATTSSQTVDGSTSVSIAPLQSLDLVSDGSNWWVI